MVKSSSTQLVRSGKIDEKQSYIPIFDDQALGIVNEFQSIWGCYLHGVFDNGAWRRSWLNHLRHQRGLPSLPTGIPNYREQREAMLANLTNAIAKHINFKPLLE